MNKPAARILEPVRQNPRLALGAGVIGGVLILAVGYLWPMVEIQNLVAQKKQMEGTIQQAAAAILPMRGSEIRRIPSAENAPELFKRFYQLAEQHRVRVVEFSPRPISMGTADQPALLPIDLQLEATYSAAGDFLGELMTNSEMGIVSVRRIDMVPDGQNAGRLRLSLSVELCLKK